MSLSYGSKFGYYGLRVNPTLEQVVGTVRNPLKIPLPDRKAKWYANSPYRALILEAEEKFQSYERAAIDYRQPGADAPASAARVRESDAAADETFDLAFVDADKTGYPAYVEDEVRAALREPRHFLRGCFREEIAEPLHGHGIEL